MRKSHQPGPDERRNEVPGEEALMGPLAEDETRPQNRDQRLHLLDDDRRHRIAVDERLREQDGGDRRRTGTDRDRRRDVTPPEPVGRHERRDEQRQDEQDEHQVLAEDDRGDARRLREGLSEQCVHAPKRGRQRDQRGGDRA